MRRAVIVILATALLAAGCGYRGDDGPGSCSGVTLWGDLSLTDALVEVEGIVDTGREVTSAGTSATYPVSSGVVTRVLYADPAIADGIAVGETLEFTRTIDPAETGGPVLLFLTEHLEEAGIPQLGFRIAAVEEADGLRFLGDRAWCWADDFSEFVKEVDWSLVEAHTGLPDGSDDLQLMTAWVQEIVDTARPRRNGPITLAWLGEPTAAPSGCQSAPADQLPPVAPFPLTLTPNPVVAGGTASLEIGVIKPDDLAGWGGSWECWNGTGWVATHQIEHGRGPGPPGAALVIEPGTITTIPAIGYRMPETFMITIPDVPPGWYRLREDIVSRGGMVAGYLAVEVVGAAATAAGREPPARTGVEPP